MARLVKILVVGIAKHLDQSFFEDIPQGFTTVEVLSLVSEQEHIRFWEDNTINLQSFEDVSRIIKKQVNCEYCQVRHVQFGGIELTNNLILWPSGQFLFPTLDVINKLESFISLEQNLRDEIFLCVDRLDQILDRLEVAVESFYAVGTLSQRIGANLKQKKDRKIQSYGKRTCKVILFDRTADITPVVLHSEHIMDQIVSVLGINLSSTLRTDMTMDQFIDDTNAKAVQVNISRSDDNIKSNLINEDMREGLLNLRKRLISKAQELNIDLKLPKILGRVTSTQFKKILKATLNSKEYRESCDDELELLVEYSLLVVQTFDKLSSGEIKWDELQGIEKILEGSVTENPVGALRAKAVEQLWEVVNKSKFTSDDLLALMAFAYGIVGHELLETDEDTLLKDAIMKNQIDIDCNSQSGIFERLKHIALTSKSHRGEHFCKKILSLKGAEKISASDGIVGGDYVKKFINTLHGEEMMSSGDLVIAIPIGGTTFREFQEFSLHKGSKDFILLTQKITCAKEIIHQYFYYL